MSIIKRMSNGDYYRSNQIIIDATCLSCGSNLSKTNKGLYFRLDRRSDLLKAWGCETCKSEFNEESESRVCKEKE